MISNEQEKKESAKAIKAPDKVFLDEIASYKELIKKYPNGIFGAIGCSNCSETPNSSENFMKGGEKEMSGYAEEQKHYQHGRLEPIEIMQDYMEPKEIYGFCIGNAIKYILRSRFKGTELQDIEKAHQYLQWSIDILHGEKITHYGKHLKGDK